jgi:histone deacetylase 1/2
VVIYTILFVLTPHQNGVVERKHRQIVELGVILLAQAALPLAYWDYAFLSSMYLINRLSTSTLSV